ncbi:HdeD family acid-resistance protein [Leucobacter sp. W1478]|uniref:HdeD family acid-resistance protein n=1 Tax=Leucobacter sp. W1478 TaxID=3439065 RepID=UPI003F351817
MAGPSTLNTEHRAVDAIRTMLGVGGLVALIVGILILVNPVKSGAVMMQIVSVIVALYAAGVGVVYLGSALFSKTMKGWPRTGNVVLGLLYIVGAVIIFANLAATAAVLTAFLSIMIGVLWIIEGIFSFTTLKESGHRVLTIIYGIISVVAGLVLILSPLLGAITLWLLLGLSMIVMGAVQIVRAFAFKPSV